MININLKINWNPWPMQANIDDVVKRVSSKNCGNLNSV